MNLAKVQRVNPDGSMEIGRVKLNVLDEEENILPEKLSDSAIRVSRSAIRNRVSLLNQLKVGLY